MPKFIIGPNHLGLEGEYELEMTFFNKDHRKIKQVSGLRVLEYQSGLEAGDLDFILALASIALDRAGKQHNIEHLYELPDDCIKFVIEEEENPPPIAPELSPEEEMKSSGLSSNGATEHSQEKSTPDTSGTPPLASSSDPLTSTI